MHKPVLLNNIINKLSFLKQNPTQKYSLIDCTLGTAGHSKTLLQTYPNLYILGLDLDKRMIKYVQQNVYNNLAPQNKERFKLKQSNFTNIDRFQCRKIFKNCLKGINFDFILADFGYNSLHLNNPDWGFSYMKDGQLDMRYSQKYRKCSEVLANISEYQLIQIFSKYGQLTNSKIIAKQILKYRQKQPITNTKHIRQAIFQAENIRDKFKCLVKIFQALRIAINGQLLDMRDFVQKIPYKLNDNGQSFLITFHSLQEQTVMKILQKQKKKNMIKRIDIQEVTAAQIEQNVSSRSGKLFTATKGESK